MVKPGKTISFDGSTIIFDGKTHVKHVKPMIFHRFLDAKISSTVSEDRKFVDLLVVGSKGQSIGLEASKQVELGLSEGVGDPGIR